MDSPGRIRHPMAMVFALALAVLVGTVAIVSLWANNQLLDTGGWVSVSGRMLESREVRNRIGTFLGERLVAETESRLDAAGEEAEAERMVPLMRSRESQLGQKVTTTARFRAIWLEANRIGHRQLLAVLDEEGGAGRGAVVIDLTPALRQLAQVLGVDLRAYGVRIVKPGALVRPGSARIQVLQAGELHQAREAVRLVRGLTLPAVLITLGLYLLALWLGRRRLPAALVGVGLAFAATGGLALLVRSITGHEIVDKLLTRGADRAAAEAAWGVASSEIADLAGWAIGIGAVLTLLAAAFLVARGTGLRRPATTVR